MIRKALLVLAPALSLSACSALDRMKEIGEKPALSAIENPVAQPGYKPVQMPMPMIQPRRQSGNSLWQSGSRAFFKDQRAGKVGEVVPQIWSYEHTLAGGQPARAFVWMQGHTYKNMTDPKVLPMVLRGIAWAGKKPVNELVDYKPPAAPPRG